MATPSHLVRVHCPDADATERLGEILGETVVPPCVIALEGDLGAGKTCLVRGLARGLGLDDRAVSSPTFVMHVEHLPVGGSGTALSHLDAYRLADLEELESIGFEELVADEDRLVAVEWASRIATTLPEGRIDLRIDIRGADVRAVTVLDGRSDEAQRARLRDAFEARAETFCMKIDDARTCPTCETTIEETDHRPFCSKRCRLVDLEGWFGGQYTISRPLDASDLLDD